MFVLTTHDKYYLIHAATFVFNLTFELGVPMTYIDQSHQSYWTDNKCRNKTFFMKFKTQPSYRQMSRIMRKLAFSLCENKDVDIAQLISTFVFATRIVQFLFFLNPKFQASRHLLWLHSLWLHRLVCVRHFSYVNNLRHIVHLVSLVAVKSYFKALNPC